MTFSTDLYLKNKLGLAIVFLENGAVKSIEAGPIRISLKESTPFSPPGSNIYLRKRGHTVTFTALTGPGSAGGFSIEGGHFISRGEWEGIEYSCLLQLSENSMSWQWSVDIKNGSGSPVDLDLVLVQDVGLKQAGSGPVNEYYVAQYLERRILQDPDHGAVICCRQNMKEAGGHPWLMIASKNGAVAGSTDGMLFYGKTYRETGIPEGLQSDALGGGYAGESSVVALQEKPFKLAPGEVHTSVFAATFMPDHPEATSEEDLKILQVIFESTVKKMSTLLNSTAKNNFNTATLLPVDDLLEDELDLFFGRERRHKETENGALLSFFTQDHTHVVLRRKELLADRPHAHIMQAGAGLVPDERIMSTTAFMCGVFNSHLTQGNTNFNTLLSICTSQFNQSRETGQRLILTLDNRQFLLGVPSAFEMGLNHCRWIYKHRDRVIQVRSWTSGANAQVNLNFKVLQGPPVGLLLTHDFDPLNDWTIVHDAAICESVAVPGKDSMIRGKFPNARFRIIVQYPGTEVELSGTESLFTIRSGETTSFCMSILCEVCYPAELEKIGDADLHWEKDRRDARERWNDLSRNLSLKGEQEDLSAIREILPWYGLDALIHYLTPYGLEQFGGAAWGTRDVSQGPVELLLTLGKYAEARQVLLTIFSNQNPDGGWPQWWMFDSYHEIRAHEAHGDIFYWCILALSSYIKTTGDTGILDEVLPYYHDKGPGYAEKDTLRGHVDRLVNMIVGSFIPGTALVPYGGGDWNDSLQPVSKELAQRLVSSWTVEMSYQAFSEYQKIAELTGDYRLSEELKSTVDRIREDFNRHLVRDGIVAGYGKVEDDGSISVMLHPGDSSTGIQYSLLPMERGIVSGLFTRAQAESHMALIERHLKGPDGARLMDKPLKYKGGIQEIFQRAESSTFFGREIGLMYVHEHIRYAEALAIMGRADEFVKALRQAIPVGYRDVVPQGDIRQANCYYSSSDVHFKSRYEADECYDDVIKGKMAVRGGWRVYSSGPGIFIGIVITRLLGLRIERENIIIDPVLPSELDDISASLDFLGYPVSFHYSVKEGNFSPKAIVINDKKVFFSHEKNRYRPGGVIIPKKDVLKMLQKSGNVVEIRL